jgi:hypothetical protein
MRSTRAVIKLRWHATAGGGGHAKSAAGLLAYVHQHDRHPDLEKTEGVEGLTRYVAWRDNATQSARLFDAEGTCGEADRVRLAQYIERSVQGMDQTPSWRVLQNRKAFYHFIISPEDARGVDLRLATRSVMSQLSRSAGTGALPPWIAAEHRNTEHPHVHVVMAARRRLESGRYRRFEITGARLEGLHKTLGSEIGRQREDQARLRSSALRAVEAASKSPLRTRESPSEPTWTIPVLERRRIIYASRVAEPGDRKPRAPQRASGKPTAGVARILGRLARQHLWEAEREAYRRRDDAGNRARGRGE